MRWMDFPPLWTVAAIGTVWALGRAGPVVDAWALDAAGVVLAVMALGLMLWAVIVMHRARTTVWPHREADALVTDGPFGVSRNPIYLGDVLLLVAAVLWTGAVAGVLVVPVLMVILTRRFISPEEARLRMAFGEAYTDWAARVRRWV